MRVGKIMSGQSKTNLGRVLQGLPFTDAERSRIAALAKTGGLPRTLISKYALDTDVFRKYAKHWDEVNKFRPNTPKYKTIATDKLIDRLNSPSKKDYDFFWGIYRAAASKFVNTEMIPLDNLCVKVQYSGSLEPADLMRCICSNAIEFEVDPDSIRTFYEVWWIPRVDIETLLSESMSKNELRLQQKAISKVTIAIDSLREQLTGLVTRVNACETAQRQIAEQNKKASEKSVKHDNAIDALSNKAEETVNIISQKIESAIVPVTKSVEQLSTKLSAIDKQAKDSVTEELLNSRLGMAISELKVSVNALSDDRNKALLQTTQEQVSAIRTQLESLANELAARIDTSATAKGGYKSLLSTGLPSTTTQSWKVTQEQEFLESWRSFLLREWSITLSQEHAIAYHAAFLANSAVITDYALVSSWISTLGWNAHAKHLVASPLWSAEEDWATGADHVFSQNPQRVPRLLVIHNYDNGLVDCYLSPSLLLWALQRSDKHLAKIFLIPTHYGTESTQLLQHTALVKSNRDDSRLHLGSIKSCPTPRSNLPVGVEPKLVVDWIKTPTTLDYDFKNLQNRFEIELSPWLIRNYRHTTSIACRYLQENSAIAVGMHHHILPWIRAQKGDQVVDEVKVYIEDLGLRY